MLKEIKAMLDEAELRLQPLINRDEKIGRKIRDSEV